MVKLYSTHCPKCNVLEKKLKENNIEFEIIDDVDEVVAFGREHEINSAPILDFDGKIMDFIAANKYLTTL